MAEFKADSTPLTVELRYIPDRGHVNNPVAPKMIRNKGMNLLKRSFRRPTPPSIITLRLNRDDLRVYFKPGFFTSILPSTLIVNKISIRMTILAVDATYSF